MRPRLTSDNLAAFVTEFRTGKFCATYRLGQGIINYFWLDPRSDPRIERLWNLTDESECLAIANELLKEFQA